MIKDRKLTDKEERKWRAEFKRRACEAVRADHHTYRPYIKRDLAVVWLREQEVAQERRDRWTLDAAIAAATGRRRSQMPRCLPFIATVGEDFSPPAPRQ